MSHNWYSIEHLEGTEWIIKCRTDFEDLQQFTEVAKNPAYRILFEGKDITKKYNKEYIKIPEVGKKPNNYVPESVEIPAMKPASYKQLSDNERSELVKKAYNLRKESYRRSDIMSQLHVTESTYDLIVKEVSALTDNTKTDKTITSTDKPVHTLKRGLFAKM